MCLAYYCPLGYFAFIFIFKDRCIESCGHKIVWTLLMKCYLTSLVQAIIFSWHDHKIAKYFAKNSRKYVRTCPFASNPEHERLKSAAAADKEEVYHHRLKLIIELSLKLWWRNNSMENNHTLPTHFKKCQSANVIQVHIILPPFK